MFCMSIEFKYRGEVYDPQVQVFSGKNWEEVSNELNQFISQNPIAWFRIVGIYQGD